MCIRDSINTITSGSGSNLVLQSNNAVTAVTIDTAQNVGIGVTPSAWSGSYKSLDISSIGSVASASSSFVLFNNSYVGASNTIYKTTGYSTAYRQGQDNGQHAWFVAPSGTINTAITFTQAMTLDLSLIHI